MAAFNGENYIRVQIESILNQLGPEDQLIIVDDASTDCTVDIIKSFKDERINLMLNDCNTGVVQTFNKALKEATGDIIFLSDQDDSWHDNKVQHVTEIFYSEDVELIVHNAILVFDGKISNSKLFDLFSSSPGVIKNIYKKNTFTGCCMAFRRSILKDVLPIPTSIGIFHDAWIGILAEFLGYKVKFISIPLIYYNRHCSNISSLKRRNLPIILRDRLIFIFLLFLRVVSISIGFKNRK